MKEKFVTPEQYEETVQTPVRLNPSLDLNSLTAPYFVEHVRRTIGDRYGFDPLLQGGLRIYTSLDTRLQSLAQRVVRDGLDELRVRLKSKDPAGTDGAAEVQAALLAMDPHSGLVRALVGDTIFRSVSTIARSRRAGNLEAPSSPSFTRPPWKAT